MIYIENPSTDAYFNLALEEYLLKERTGLESVFLLWQNASAVVVGRNQNTMEEVNSEFAEKNGIQVVRRLSGGGAVYHDLGNLNYTFIVPDNERAFDFRFFSDPVVLFLQSLGLPAEHSGRNDMILNGKKFSGNAQARSRNRLLHHGTLLFDTNINQMTAVLNVSPDKFQSKAVSSVRSRVLNLKEVLPVDVSLTVFRTLIQEQCLKFAEKMENKPSEHRFLTEQERFRVEQIRNEKYAVWDWNYGHSPKFDVKVSKRFDWGKIEFRLSINNGQICSVQIFGDFFHQKETDFFAQSLLGKPFERHILEQKINDVLLKETFPLFSKTEFLELLFAPEGI